MIRVMVRVTTDTMGDVEVELEHREDQTVKTNYAALDALIDKTVVKAKVAYHA